MAEVEALIAAAAASAAAAEEDAAATAADRVQTGIDAAAAALSASAGGYVTGAAGDGITDDEATINAAIEARPDGGNVRLQPTVASYLIGAPLVIPTGVALEGDGHANTCIKLADNSDCDMLQTKDFSTLAGTGVSLVAAGVQHGFRIGKLRLDGNKANQASGDGIKIYGKRYEIDDLVITKVKGVGFYAEVGNDGANTATTWADMPEANIRYLTIDSCGSHNFQYRGRTDAHITGLFSRLSGGRGASFEASGVLYNGLADLTFVHSYANALEGVYAGVRIKCSHLEF